jgi:hypothetical protein
MSGLLNKREIMAADAMKRLACNPVVSCRDEGTDGAVLFNPDTNDLVIINPTGRTVWDYISTPRTLDEIAAHLEEHFRIGSAADQIMKDLKEFMQTLIPDFVQEA